MRKALEVIIDSTNDGIISIDVQGIITIFNKTAERLTGVKKEYAIGKHIKKVILDTRLMHVLKTGKVEEHQQHNIGNLNIITSRIPVKNNNGEIIGAVAIFRDTTDIIKLASKITNLEEVHSMLEAVLYSTQDAISVVDQNGIHVMINPAYTRLTGLCEKDILGKLATVDISEGESIHLKVLDTMKPVKNARLKVGPRKKEVLATAAPIIVNGELRGSVGVLHDVTEFMRLTNELKVAKQIIRKLEAKYTFDDIVGENNLILSAIEKAKKAAKLPVTVILRGESGTGKELFAHAIHNSSDRKFNQFIRVNCAALTDSLLESELFGYEEGAFTGAKKGGKKGLFEEASGGTIFLDEIGEISLSNQVKLLRVLQEKEIIRVGGNKPISVDVRVIAATNINLEEAIKKGTYREDLYYRLNVFPIRIPALRYRKDDIYLLALNCIKKLNQEYGRVVEDISSQAVDVLKCHNWPGNVRELENVIGRAMISIKLNEEIIKPFHLPKIHNNEYHHVNSNDFVEEEIKEYESLKHLIEKTEKKHILKVLKLNNYNKTKTAKILDISIRNLYYKLDKYGLDE